MQVFRQIVLAFVGGALFALIGQLLYLGFTVLLSVLPVRDTFLATLA